MKKKAKKEPTRSDGNVRVPRPLGTTMRAMAIRGEPDPEKQGKMLKEFQLITIDRYIGSGMQLNGRMYDIQEISNYIGMPVERTMIAINRGMERIGNILKGQDGLNIARVTFFGLLKNGLEIAAQSKAQAELLVAEQGGKYVPFLTSAANQAIKNSQDGLKPIMDLLRMMQGTGGQGVGSPMMGATEAVGNADYMDTDKAITIINQTTQSILNSPALLEAKATTIDMPEVRANHQDLSSIGIRNFTLNDAPELTRSSGALEAHAPKTTPKPDHADRREASLGGHINEVLDADDFQA